MRTLRERFEENFVADAESGCWLWTANRQKNGYGLFSMNGTPRGAHRIAYELYVGPIPDGLYVCHACDVKRCVRPDHLWLGTQADNLADMVRKGRSATGDKHGTRTRPERVASGDKNGSRKHPERLARGDSHYSRLHPERISRGEQHYATKLTDEDVIAIRAAVGLTQKQIAIQYNVVPSTIGLIRGGKTWAHLLPTNGRSKWSEG